MFKYDDWPNFRINEGQFPKLTFKNSFMNAIGWFILVAVLIAHVIDTLAEWLNMRAADTVLPPALVHLYDEEAYEKAQTYLKSNTRFGMFKRVLDLVALLLFWFLGGFGWLDVVARSFGWGEIA
ncbi:MAG TPA: hypothetical protein PLL64_14670, partial [Rhodothermales bacterium]|nr:hypothetical protein [Rhodothermales bacterium]